MKKKRVLLGISLFMGLLAGCSFKYSKAIAIAAAEELLEAGVARTKNAANESSSLSLGAVQEGPIAFDEAEEATEQEATFFTIYRSLEKGFSYDYYEKSGDDSALFLTIDGDEQGNVEAYDNLQKAPYSFSSEEDAEDAYRYGLSFRSDFSSFVGYFLDVSSGLMSLLINGSPNSLTDFGATSDGDGGLILSFEGEGLSLPSLFDVNVFSSLDIAEIKVTFSAYLLTEATAYYGEDEEGSVSFYFAYQ